MDSELIDGTIHRKLGFLPLESTGFWPILVNFALKPNRGFTCCRGCHCSGIFRAEYLSSGELRWAAVGIEGRAHGPNGKGEVNLVTYAQGTKDLKVQSLPNNRRNIKKAIRIQAGTSQVAEDGRGGCKCHTLLGIDSCLIKFGYDCHPERQHTMPFCWKRPASQWVWCLAAINRMSPGNRMEAWKTMKDTPESLISLNYMQYPLDITRCPAHASFEARKWEGW